jgi:hypothetical protein
VRDEEVAAISSHMSEGHRDWKLKLRHGHLTTPFTHFTVMAEGVAGTLSDGFECCPGSAIMTMKVWAMSAEQAAEMITSIGGRIGFRVASGIDVYVTEPTDAPQEQPYGYDIRFTPFEA